MLELRNNDKADIDKSGHIGFKEFKLMVVDEGSLTCQRASRLTTPRSGTNSSVPTAAAMARSTSGVRWDRCNVTNDIKEEVHIRPSPSSMSTCSLAATRINHPGQTPTRTPILSST